MPRRPWAAGRSRPLRPRSRRTPRSPPGGFYLLPGHLPPRGDGLLVALGGGSVRHLHAVAHPVQQPVTPEMLEERWNFRPISVRTLAAVHTWSSVQPCAAGPSSSHVASRGGSRSRRGPWNAAPRVRPSSRRGATGRPTSHSPVTPGRCSGLPRPPQRGQRPASAPLPGACAARRSARPRPDTACLRRTSPDGLRHRSRHRSRPQDAEISNERRTKCHVAQRDTQVGYGRRTLPSVPLCWTGR